MSDMEDMDDYGDNWEYIEDYWDEALDLAEYTCPSPVSLNENAHTEEYDLHDYWQDIEYASDGGYFEDHKSSTKKRKGTQNLHKVLKRTIKRRKILHGTRQPLLGTSPVKWIAQKDRNHLLISETSSTPTQTPVPSVSLLQNWQERFKHTQGVSPTFAKSASVEPSVQIDNFDLGDLQSVAELLTKENMDALQHILKAKGVNADALQMVMEDMLTGTERAFEEEADDDLEVDGEDVLPDQEGVQHNTAEMEDEQQGLLEIPLSSANRLSHPSSSEIQPRTTRLKRKARFDYEVTDETFVQGTKKHRRHL